MKLKHRERIDTRGVANILRELAAALEAGHLELEGRSFELPAAEAELSLKVEMEEDELELKVEISWDFPERRGREEGPFPEGSFRHGKAIKKRNGGPLQRDLP